MSDESLSAPTHISFDEVASASHAESSSASDGEKTLMRRTLVAQGKKIQQLTAKIDVLETEREAMRQQIGGLRMAVFEASTRAEQTAQQCKRDAVDAAVREIAQDREAFAGARTEAVTRIGELEGALEIALKAAGGVHKQLLDLGLSCEDLGKTSVHLSIAAKEAPPEDKPALAVAGETIEAVVGVMRAMEGSGVFDILDPVNVQQAAGRDTVPEPPSQLAIADPAGPTFDDNGAAEGILLIVPSGGSQTISPLVEHVQGIEIGDGGGEMGEGTRVQGEREGIRGDGTEPEDSVLAHGEERARTLGEDGEDIDNEGMSLILVPGGRDMGLYPGGGGVHEYGARGGRVQGGGVGEEGLEAPLD